MPPCASEIFSAGRYPWSRSDFPSVDFGSSLEGDRASILVTPNGAGSIAKPRLSESTSTSDPGMMNSFASIEIRARSSSIFFRTSLSDVASRNWRFNQKR